MPHAFSSASRLRRRSDFSGVFDGGVKRHGRMMTLLVRPRPIGPSRLGVATGRKLGSAVERNQVKRRVRELFRQANQPSALDIVVIPRRTMLTAPFSMVRLEFEGLLDWASRHGRRLPPPVSQPDPSGAGLGL